MIFGDDLLRLLPLLSALSFLLSLEGDVLTDRLEDLRWLRSFFSSMEVMTFGGDRDGSLFPLLLRLRLALLEDDGDRDLSPDLLRSSLRSSIFFSLDMILGGERDRERLLERRLSFPLRRLRLDASLDGDRDELPEDERDETEESLLYSLLLLSLLLRFPSDDRPRRLSLE
mmetsp:Transcript_4465/g.12903  ORF Transcript_4465/g.12903 Transcript_4465/m.12903 type:complete len:171 (-) Transcript_4465:2239-2751(-)